MKLGNVYCVSFRYFPPRSLCARQNGIFGSSHLPWFSQRAFSYAGPPSWNAITPFHLFTFQISVQMSDAWGTTAWSPRLSHISSLYTTLLKFCTFFIPLITIVTFWSRQQNSSSQPYQTQYPLFKTLWKFAWCIHKWGVIITIPSVLISQLPQLSPV